MRRANVAEFKPRFRVRVCADGRVARRPASFSRGSGIASTKFKPPRRIRDDDDDAPSGDHSDCGGATAGEFRDVGTGADLIQFARQRAQPRSRTIPAGRASHLAPRRAAVARATRVDLF